MLTFEEMKEIKHSSLIYIPSQKATREWALSKQRSRSFRKKEK